MDLDKNDPNATKCVKFTKDQSPNEEDYICEVFPALPAIFCEHKLSMLYPTIYNSFPNYLCNSLNTTGLAHYLTYLREIPYRMNAKKVQPTTQAYQDSSELHTFLSNATNTEETAIKQIHIALHIPAGFMQ